MAKGVPPAKRLSENAWDALLEALAVFYWYKRDLESFLNAVLADDPQLQAKISFTSESSKREIATSLVQVLRKNEDRYQDLAIDLLVRLAAFDSRFPRLAILEDGEVKVGRAKSALDEVITITAAYSDRALARERLREEAANEKQNLELRRTRERVLGQLKTRFLELHQMDNVHQRGKLFETLLNELFDLEELQPRAAYNLAHEQIDGAFTFQNDDYLLEAKWWSKPLEPKELNNFKAKIESKAKHTLGLLVAINGFTKGAVVTHSSGTPLILMDGADVYAVLDGRIGLAESLERKRRHAAETGSPMLHVSEMPI